MKTRISSKNRPISALITALQEAGVSRGKTQAGVRQTLQTWIERGVLVLRRMPQSRRYVVSDKEIQTIVKAFSPEGEGYYHYESLEEGGETVK
jgi:hypothetical protein